METSFRVLVVEDSEPFRKFVCSMLAKRPELRIVGEVFDGLEAVHKAEELQPDLIVLDIGLPSLNGIEAARKIRKLSPESKILFVSQENSGDVVQGAFAAGARGYVFKADAGSELLAAVRAVLQGGQFVSGRFAGHDFTGASYAGASPGGRSDAVAEPLQQGTKIVRHNVGFYSDDRSLLDHLVQFVGTSLKTGDAAMVVATKSHLDSLLPRLQAHGVDIVAAIEQGRYIPLNANDALSIFILGGMPDPMRFSELLGNRISNAIDAGKKGRVAVFGECVNLLWAQGNPEATVRLERLWNEEIVSRYNVDVLCGYCLATVPTGMDSSLYEKICAEHSAVYSR